MQNLSEVVEANGKTVRQNNLEMKHKIKIGSKVQIDHESCGDTTYKISGELFVVEHTRDCDGSPLYMLSNKNLCLSGGLVLVPENFKAAFPDKNIRDWVQAEHWWKMFHFNLYGPFGEESLKYDDEQIKRLKEGCNCQCGGIGEDGRPCPNPCMADPPCDEMERELRIIDHKLSYMKQENYAS